MSTQAMSCKYCDNQILHMPYANMILFYPACKHEIFVESEYGYGPVSPCFILLGEDSIGIVAQNNKHEYSLQMKSDEKRIRLRESYLKALHNASNIVRRILRPKARNQQAKSLKIKILGGSLCFYGDWFGRSYDNFHGIEHCFYQDDVLEIAFDERDRLIIFEPIGITNTDKEFSIKQSKLVKWSWFPYGSAEKEMETLTYELKNGVVHKIGRFGEQCLERKEPYVSVFLG